jgi:flagellin-like hook-associated protein FlgL
MVVYSTASIIAQVGEAMIAQANVSNQGVLALLQ